MAPHNLEDNIRKKLDARSIQPSANAWDKLEAKLDATKPKKRPVFWYLAAASFVGFVIVTSVFLFTNNSEIENQIVENNNLNAPVYDDDSKKLNNNFETAKIASEDNTKEVPPQNSSTKQDAEKQTGVAKQKPALSQQSEIDKKIKDNRAIAKTSAKQNTTPKSVEELIVVENDDFFKNKVNEVVASVKKLQEDNDNITATEVENLLNNARRDIEMQRILNNQKVDANALLQDVEWELERSFRDKVFEALGEGFNKVRTAVLERND
ncbi:MAG: hypothetical protein CL526_02195 [Aequorivita sp.]|nr:hypothetical protein [Aequorivita sp.]|tara:strand:+ start:26614 stop:27411 length:798 start_codon:yes stop_codon:yes gene_type:complete